MTDEERVKLLESYSYCPQGQAGEHGQHPKCKECRFSKEVCRE